LDLTSGVGATCASAYIHNLMVAGKKYSSDEDNADSNKVDLTELDNGNKSCEAVAKAAGCTFVPSDKAQKEWERYCEKMKL